MIDSTEDELSVLLDESLRPSRLTEFIGQKEVLENLSVYIQAAKKRNGALDHVLVSGPPGLGKTTLAGIIAFELGSGVTVTSAQVITKGADLAKLLTTLNKNDILFIDEIHSLNRKLEEILYPAMENFQIDLIVGEGITAQSVQIPLKPFTLIGATTRSGLISDPLKSRFGIQLRFDYYSDDEMAVIVKRSAQILGFPIDNGAAFEIGRRSRKTPRIANHLLKRIRDFAEIENQSIITIELTKKALQKMAIDELGLDLVDRQILDCLIRRFKGGPAGLKSISAVVGEEEKTIEDVHEAYMVRTGLMQRTPMGRIATDMAYAHLKIQREETDAENTLF